MKKKTVAAMLALCMGLSVGCGGKTPPKEQEENEIWKGMTEQERTVAMLASTDDFNRTFTLSGAADEKKYVGMFYFTLHGQIPREKIYDVTQITGGDSANVDAFYEHAAQRPEGTAYFWGKPVWDYYSQTDPWVIRKQIEMLTMAGVDFLFIDVTNAFTNAQQNDNTEALLFVNATYLAMEIVHEYLGKGWNAPKLMFYTNNNGTNGTKNSACEKPNDDINIVNTIYKKFYQYQNGKYNDVWFAPNGKPMIIMTKESRQILSVADEIEEPENYALSRYFEFKYTIWPNDKTEDPNDLLGNSFPWMETYYNGNYCKIRDGVVNISVAQHMNTIRFSDTDKNFGRGYDYEQKKNVSADTAKATNYEYLWQQALAKKADINMVTLTGWNEWTASTVKLGGLMRLVDSYNEEYSRDIEPTYGVTKDNCYLQTARNIRSYKYDVPLELTYPAATVDIANFDENVWKSGKKYLDFTGECIERNHAGWVTDPQSSDYKTLTDDTNRNDIESIAVLHDDNYIYFRIMTADVIKPAADENDTGWMNVMIGTNAASQGSLFGYNYVINRSRTADGCSISRVTAAKEYEAAGEARLALQEGGKVLQIAVPRSALGLTDGVPAFTFKVCDNITDTKDVLSYYNSGDAAPIGRLGYVYGK